MKRFTLGLLAVASLLACVLPTSAETYKSPKGGIQFDAPDEWKADTSSGDVMKLTAGEEGLTLSAWAVDKGSFDEACDALGTELEKIIKESKATGEPEKKEVNGLHVVYVTGTGKVNDVEVEWMVWMVAAEHPVLFTIVGTPEAVDTHKDELTKMLSSIRKTEE